MTDIEFDSVESMAVGAVGEPGRRTFMLQAKGPSGTVTLIVEKEHVIGLGQGAMALLAEIGEAQPGAGVPWEPPIGLDESQEPMWHVARLALGFDPERDMVMIECVQLVEEGQEPQHARFWLSKEQLGSLATNGIEIAVQGGRSICPHCALPMEVEGHICPTGNGHRELPV